MALARKRDWYFQSPLMHQALWAIVTLGTWPLLVQSKRFDRFRRLEWNQYHGFAQWLSSATQDSIAADLEVFAERAAGRPSSRLAAKVCVVGALLLAAIVFYRLHDWEAVLKTAFWPQSLFLPAVVFSAILGVGWFSHVMGIVKQQAMTRLWIGRLNELLAAHEKRPLPIGVSKPNFATLLAASALAIVGPTWAAVALIALVIQNRYTGNTRAARLAMLERMLEWMDTSGLPVEFDIEEIEPEELVSLA